MMRFLYEKQIESLRGATVHLCGDHQRSSSTAVKFHYGSHRMSLKKPARFLYEDHGTLFRKDIGLRHGKHNLRVRKAMKTLNVSFESSGKPYDSFTKIIGEPFRAMRFLYGDHSESLKVL